jgi:competence protein ComFB
MALRDEYDFESLVNEAESRVLQELESQIAKDPEVCRCQDCVLDMAACALNGVKPSYHVSLIGSVYAKSSGETDDAKEIRRAVREAIQKIKANPSHD